MDFMKKRFLLVLGFSLTTLGMQEGTVAPGKRQKITHSVDQTEIPF